MYEEPSTRKTWSPFFTGREAGAAAGAAVFADALAMALNIGLWRKISRHPGAYPRLVRSTILPAAGRISAGPAGEPRPDARTGTGAACRARPRTARPRRRWRWR